MRLVHLAFGDRTLLEEVAWATMAPLPKRKGYYRGIGLVKVTWNVCAAMVNFRLKQSVELHDSLHRFR